jgi:hypothetical protein
MGTDCYEPPPTLFVENSPELGNILNEISANYEDSFHNESSRLKIIGDVSKLIEIRHSLNRKKIESLLVLERGDPRIDEFPENIIVVSSMTNVDSLIKGAMKFLPQREVSKIRRFVETAIARCCQEEELLLGRAKLDHSASFSYAQQDVEMAVESVAPIASLFPTELQARSEIELRSQQILSAAATSGIRAPGSLKDCPDIYPLPEDAFGPFVASIELVRDSFAATMSPTMTTTIGSSQQISLTSTSSSSSTSVIAGPNFTPMPPNNPAIHFESTETQPLTSGSDFKYTASMRSYSRMQSPTGTTNIACSTLLPRDGETSRYGTINSTSGGNATPNTAGSTACQSPMLPRTSDSYTSTYTATPMSSSNKDTRYTTTPSSNSFCHRAISSSMNTVAEKAPKSPLLLLDARYG